MDNFFSSVRLCQILLQRNTYVCGTIRANRKGYPDRPKNARLTARGEFQSAVVEDNLIPLFGRIKKNVHFVNTTSLMKLHP